MYEYQQQHQMPTAVEPAPVLSPVAAPERTATLGDAPLVLVVDDDPRSRYMHEVTLQAEYRLLLVENGREALRAVMAHQPALVLLDLSMPVLDGWATFERLRDVCDVPIVIVTGKTADHEVERGLDLGAADYVTKPFSPVQLRARVRATLRRRHHTHATEAAHLRGAGSTIEFDRTRRTVRVAGQEVGLTRTEFRLFEVLAERAGQVVATEELLASVWGPHVQAPSYVTTYIGYLRKKIEPDPAHPRYLRSRRGLGYYLEQ
jgi:DNA-binding response OmpR family regulator